MADISCSGRALAEALKRQRETLKRLLREAGVPVEAAEDLLTDAIAAISVEEVAHLSEVDLKLLRRVDAACAEYAANRQPACKGLKRRAARRRPRAERKGRGGV